MYVRALTASVVRLIARTKVIISPIWSEYGAADSKAIAHGYHEALKKLSKQYDDHELKEITFCKETYLDNIGWRVAAEKVARRDRHMQEIGSTLSSRSGGIRCYLCVLYYLDVCLNL